MSPPRDQPVVPIIVTGEPPPLIGTRGLWSYREPIRGIFGLLVLRRSNRVQVRHIVS
jgi:hypothetical protein